MRGSVPSTRLDQRFAAGKWVSFTLHDDQLGFALLVGGLAQTASRLAQRMLSVHLLHVVG